MNRRDLIAILASLVVLVSSVGTEAAVVDLQCHFTGYPPGTYDWDFDYDTQHLTVNDTIAGIPGPPGAFPDVFSGFGISGTVDVDSRFTVTRTITNGTTVPWTSFLLLGGPMPASLSNAGIVYDTIEVTKLHTVIRLYAQEFEFTEPPPVLPGESFTMQFEMQTSMHGQGSSFHAGYAQQIVPEPATAVLFGAGFIGLRVLLRRKRL